MEHDATLIRRWSLARFGPSRSFSAEGIRHILDGVFDLDARLTAVGLNGVAR